MSHRSRATVYYHLICLKNKNKTTTVMVEDQLHLLTWTAERYKTINYLRKPKYNSLIVYKLQIEKCPKKVKNIDRAYVSMFVLLPLSTPDEGRTQAIISPEHRTYETDFAEWMPFLPSNLIDKISPNPEAVSANTKSLSSACDSWKDNNDLSINVLILPIE